MQPLPPKALIREALTSMAQDFQLQDALTIQRVPHEVNKYDSELLRLRIEAEVLKVVSARRTINHLVNVVQDQAKVLAVFSKLLEQSKNPIVQENKESVTMDIEEQSLLLAQVKALQNHNILIAQSLDRSFEAAASLL